MSCACGDILFPTDFSAGSDYAFRHAQHLAAHDHCRLIILHVAPPTSTNDVEGPTCHDELRRKLNRMESNLAELDRRLVVAKPGPAICGFAKQLNCRLIFMSAPKIHSVVRLGFGSVHDFVLRHATCPVLSLRNHVIKESAEPEVGFVLPQLGVAPG